MGLFGKKNKNDSRLLKLDDVFTTAAKNESSDPSGTCAIYERNLRDIEAIPADSLSVGKQGLRERLISIHECRISDLRNTSG